MKNHQQIVNTIKTKKKHDTSVKSNNNNQQQTNKINQHTKQSKP